MFRRHACRFRCSHGRLDESPASIYARQRRRRRHAESRAYAAGQGARQARYEASHSSSRVSWSCWVTVDAIGNDRKRHGPPLMLVPPAKPATACSPVERSRKMLGMTLPGYAGARRSDSRAAISTRGMPRIFARAMPTRESHRRLRCGISPRLLDARERHRRAIS